MSIHQTRRRLVAVDRPDGSREYAVADPGGTIRTVGTHRPQLA